MPGSRTGRVLAVPATSARALRQAPGELAEECEREAAPSRRARGSRRGGSRGSGACVRRADARDPAAVGTSSASSPKKSPGPSSIVPDRQLDVDRRPRRARTCPSRGRRGAASDLARLRPRARRRAPRSRARADLAQAARTDGSARSLARRVISPRRDHAHRGRAGAAVAEREPRRAASGRTSGSGRSSASLTSTREPRDDARGSGLLERGGALDRDAADAGVLEREPAQDAGHAPGLLGVLERRVAQPRRVEQEAAAAAAAPGRRRRRARACRAARRRPRRPAR